MLKIDNSLLVEIGLGGLPETEKNPFLKHIYETLEMRVGIRLADQMTNEQLDEFEKYFEAKDDAGAFKWLETNFPNYKEIVQQEFDKLKSEIAQTAPQILAASQAAAAQAAPAADASPVMAPAQPQPQVAPLSPAPSPVSEPPVAPEPVPAPAAPTPSFAPQTPVDQPIGPQPVPPVQPIAPAAAPVTPFDNPISEQPVQPSPPDFPAQQPPAGPGVPPVAPQF